MSALKRHGVPEQILTDNGKVFTGRFGPGPGPVLFDKVCADNGIRHLLTAPYSPTTTGKVERLHKTMRAEFFTEHDRAFATIEELQAALDVWVVEYNTVRPHQSCGGRPPAERFALARSDIAVVDVETVQPGGRAAGGASWWDLAVGQQPWPDLVGGLRATWSAPTYAGRGGGGRGGRAGWWRSCTAGCWSPPTPSGCGPTRRTGPRCPASSGAGPGPRRDDRADRDPAGRRDGCGQLRRDLLRVWAALGPDQRAGRDRRRLGPTLRGRQGDPGPPDPPRPVHASSAPSPPPEAGPDARTPPSATPSDLARRAHCALRCRRRGGRPASGAAPPSSRACGRCATACGRPGRASLRGPSG